MTPQYLLHTEIDKKRWDNCIATASNGLIYAESFYLDTMCPGWDALVTGDYKIVMPLPRRKKFGFHYLFQPFLTPQLGLFGNDIYEELLNDFLGSLPAGFKLLDISLNHSNQTKNIRGKFTRRNYILPLDDVYENISSRYHDNINRSLSKAARSGCTVKKDISIAEVIRLCKKEYPKFTKTEKGLFEKLAAVFNHYYKQNRAVTYGVYLGEQLLSVAAFLFSHRRAYYWLVSNDPSSRSYGSSSQLTDTFIKEHAGRNLLLDFEGSDEEGVADFYKKFGAVNEPYITIYKNKLPFPINLFKPLPEHYRNLQ